MKTHVRYVQALLCLVLIFLLSLSHPAKAQGTTLAPSKRVVINMGQRPWKFIVGDNIAMQNPAFNDSSWESVGLPHTADMFFTFTNETSGGGAGDLNGNVAWYREHFTVDSQYANDKVQVVFEGVHTGVQVYINGTLVPATQQFAPQATHVVGFLPFVVDLTPYLHFGGDNVIAVRVARNAGWFPSPGFSQAFRFGQADNGIFRPVYMYITDKIHIPENIYSGSKTWGTYVATDAINDDSATIHVQTNVMNEGTTPQDVTLTTQIVDANGSVVASRQDVQTVISSAAANPQPTLFDQTLTVNHPTLWYPNNSIYGKPYMYKVFHIISVNGVVIDAKQSPLGIRTITWDNDFVYINGKLQKLWGGAGRYDYPGFASSVPEEQKWRDLQQMAAMGGNLWRPGHSPESEEFVNAADALGVMVVQPSGDGENGFSDPCGPTAKMTCEQEELKQELHRDMIIRDRSHPSILAWEADNGVTLPAFAQQLAAIGKQWDYLGSDGPINGPRGGHAQSDRSGGQPQFANNGDFMSCSGNGCDIGVKDGIPDKPAWGAEYWGPGVIRGDHDHEISMAAQYIDNWSRGIAKHTFGLAQWYFADSPGEIGTFTDLPEDDVSHNTERSIGDSMVDFERFPRLLYYIDEANWTPYSVKHVVKLAHTWNRSGNIQVNAWSNCPAVRLLINGVPQGQDQIPNPSSSQAANDRDFVATELTTSLPGQVHWNVTWQPGTATAQCLDQLGQVATDANGKPVVDTLTTADAPDHIVLENVANVVRPDGTSFQVTANGADAQFVVAKVVDANGVVVPGASNLLTFSVSGPGTYVGGTQQMVTVGQPHSYHAPGDPELAAEDGLQKIAIRSQFTPGVVTVAATSPGLTGASTQFNIFPIPQQITTATAPAIIAEPVDTSVTQGFPAHFSVTASGADPLAFQWYKNGVAIPGATSAAVDTAPTASSDDQSAFSVTVTNSLGSATSTNARLTVVAAAAPAITAQPMSQTASQGQTVTFSVQATGSPKLTYQWTRNGAPIAGAILSSYTTPTLSVSDSGSVYAVTVTNPVNSAVSTNAKLTVNPAVAPQIVTDLVNVAALPGQPATFSVTVSGTQPILYVWQKDGTTVGSNSPTLTIDFVSNGDLGTYSVTATNIAGQAVSKGATLTLAPPGVNMSLGKVGLGSSFENAVGLASKFAIDGDLTSRWGSAFSDPQSYQIDFGVPMTFNRAVINWDPSHATQYTIQVSNDGQSWSGPVYSQDSGTGGKEDFTFPAQHARYIRMFGTQRNDNFGYSIREFETYNAASCGNTNERWTIDPNNLTVVTDNLSGMVWTRTQKTDNTAGAQFTQVSAINYCQSLGMRIPTLAEAQAISGSSAASCAFPAFWATWTSTDDPGDNSRAFNVDATGNQFFGIKVNSPGATLCVQGPEQQPPVITQQPAPVTVAAAQQATFSVVATTTGNGSPTYTWLKNNVPFQITGVPTVTTPVVTTADNGALYSVIVTGGNGLSTTSTAGVLTVTSNPGGGGGATCTAAPSTPGTLNASATASGQIDMVWGASTAGNGCAVTYSVYRGTTAGVTPSTANLRVSTSATAFTDAGLTPSTTYFYIVVASDSVGASAASNTASATTSAGCATNCPTEVIAISAGGPAAGDFAADEDFTGGNPSGSNATVNTSGVANPAPQSVYQHIRVGNSTYTLPGLTPGASYTVRLHFNEFFWTQPGQRVFNVSINGTQVLSNFDVLAAAGGKNVAIAEQFTANANAQGQIVIQFTTVKDNAEVSGIEVLASTATTTPPAAPSNLTATVASSSQINLSWTASSTSGVTYMVLRNGAAVASGLTGTTYIDTGLTASTTYSYTVEAVDAGGSSLASNTATATTQAGGCTTNCGMDVIAISAGGPAVGNFAADEDFIGGHVSGNNATINTSGVTNPAPQSVYQHQRYGNFTYTLPGLTPGASYMVRLHFAESFWTLPGQRVFNVSINGTQVLSNFDILATAGGKNVAIVEQFTTTADAQGQIVVQFATIKDNAEVSGIEVLVAPPVAATNLTATATSASQIKLSWTASVTSGVTYTVLRNGTSVASGLIGTTYTDTGLTASTNYSYTVEAVNAAGASPASNTTSATTLAAIPVAPSNLTATAASSSQINLGWTASATSGVTYTVLRNGAAVATGLTGTAYTDTGLTASTTYSYAVEAVNAAGTSQASNTATATTPAGGCTTNCGPDVIAISAGGPAAGNFAADEDFIGGRASANNATINTSGVTNPAPQSVYQHQRFGNFTYTLPGFTPGASYAARLHFAENFWTLPGQRVFNVSINGTQVLSNFDILATAGGKNVALVEQFTAIANTQGQIVIQFITVKDNAEVSGIEVLAAPPVAPTNLTATATSASQINLSWTVSATPGVTYTVLRNGTAVASGLTGTTYTDTGLTASTTYSYTVEAVNAAGTSPVSNTASATTSAANTLTITTQPANQTANVGSTATFTVVASGTGPFTYQWLKNGTPIAGATSASYTTPTLASTDNGEQFSVIVGNATSTVTSTAGTLTVNNSGAGYPIFPGFIGVDLNNNTNGVWADNQIYVTVIGIDPKNHQFAYLNFDGTVVDFTLNDIAAANHLTGPNGQNYGNYSFTLAQSKLLKIPTLISARAYISLGNPLYVRVNGDANGNVTGWAGPNPQNGTDPNFNTHFDWYEFNNQNGIFINTTQVDEFGLPLLLDVWGAGGTFHQQVGITESIAQIDSEFAAEVPAQFQPPTMSNLRIFAPAKLSMASGGANSHYFDNYIATAWQQFSTTPLTVTLNGRQFRGTTSGSTFTFTEVNPSTAHVGEIFVVQQPSTQDLLGCAGTMATGVPGTTPQLRDENAIQLQLENQICSATNRGVLLNPANWTNVSAYYGTAPANFYSQFWHKHSIGGLAYGFSYDDNNNQSTTITTPQPEHMAFGIGW